MKALAQVLAARDVGDRDADVDAYRFTSMAEFMASRGVLVPSALTDEELVSLGGPEHPEHEPDCVGCAGERREKLERIAKGEPA